MCICLFRGFEPELVHYVINIYYFSELVVHNTMLIYIYIYNINNFGYSGGSGRKIPYPTRDHSNRLITRFGSDGYFRIRVDSVSLSSVGGSGGWVGFLGSCTGLDNCHIIFIYMYTSSYMK